MCGKIKTLGKTALFFILGVLIPAETHSHPHLFIDAGVVFQTQQETVTGIRYTWVFDDMFSRLVLTDYDIDKDQKLSEREISRIKKDVFDNLAHYNFFTHIENLRFQTVLDFTVTVQAGRLPVEDLAATFSRENVRRLKEYLNQNQYIDDDNHLLETYLGHTDLIQKWMRANLGKDAEPMIRYLDFSTGKRMVYSFVLPLSRPVPLKGLEMRLMDETNYTAIEIKKAGFDKAVDFSCDIIGTTITAGKVR
jgi:ABC-type uncharacterized transport system substrate-binding protein